VVHEQAAGFVLDALDADEAENFERHLRLCPACEDELEALRVAAAALAFAGELPPPRPALRRRVLAVDASALRIRRRWTAPLVSAAALAACAALVIGLSRQPRPAALGLSLLVDARGATLVTRGLPPAPMGKVYGIWFTRGDFATPAGFLHGRTTRLERPVPPGAGVAVTLEPAGGSRGPTGPLLLRTETA
jgi:Anti-sigma-K factor rskA, C-terminal/Putative zinc-finger